jgi:hypothetical protein
MKKVIVTPGFRKRYLEILHNQLQYVKNEFDEWVIWVNTTAKEDIDYMVYLKNNFNYIKLQYAEIPINGTASLPHYWRKCVDLDSIYLRLDEDIVYVHPNSLTKLYNKRLENEQPFLMYGNIVNNAIHDFLYQKHGIIKPEPVFSYNYADSTGIHSSDFIKYLHELFLESYRNGTLDKFLIPDWELSHFERCSINVFSCTGKDFSTFGGNVAGGEEAWLSCVKPQSVNRPNMIYGDTLFVHFAFYTQRVFLETSTNLLQQYKELSEKLIK